MVFFLSKFLLFLLRPLVWFFAISVLAFFAKTKVLKKRMLLSAFALLLFFSNKAIFNAVAKWYEPTYPKTQKYDVGILLGGFSNYNPITHSLKSEFSVDRLVQTIKLYHDGTIDQILMTGGSGKVFEKYPVEGVYTEEYLKEIKIPDSAIIIESKSRNTKENFTYSAEMLKAKQFKSKALVITSAWHIPRAKLIAEKQGLTQFDYYPTNSFVTELSFFDYFLPQSNVITYWEVIIKEWVGYLLAKFNIT